MSLMRFSLNGIVAFRNKDKHKGVRHLCVDCARLAREKRTLIPFLDDQLNATLSDFGKDLGSIILCDECGEVIATYYPEAFWTSRKTEERGGDYRSLILKKF